MLAGIRAAQEAGLEPVKINSVLLRGINDDGAADLLAGHIKNGSQGVWGPIPMPPNPVTEEEAKILAEWVLSHK